MGGQQSILQENGFKLVTETESSVVVTKGDDKFFMKKISSQTFENVGQELASEVEILKEISHPHIVSCKDSFTDQNTHYVVMEYCQGGNLAAKIKGMNQPPSEPEVLSCFVEICIALKAIHEKGLLHKHLTVKNVFLTQFGIVSLGNFGKIYESGNTRKIILHRKYSKHSYKQDMMTLSNSKNTADSDKIDIIHFLAPEVFTEGTYDVKSDIWSLGCILYELCTQQPAFSADTPIKLMPKITSGPYPSLPENFSSELCELLTDMLNRNPDSRQTASEILQCPFIIDCLFKKCKTTVKELQNKLDDLRKVADGLERVHHRTTVGSLAGGVIGALGGVTSIVGLILAPFTLGASLAVAGVGAGVGALGGVTAGASNITKMVNESSDRKTVRSIIREFQEKTEAVVTWLQEISNSLQTIKNRYDSADTSEGQKSGVDQDNLIKLGFRAGRGLGGIAELVRLLQVANISKIAAQTSRLLRVAEVATGVFAGLFVAVDVFFIAMDAKEIHHIRQAKAAEERGPSFSESVSKTEINDSRPTSDKGEPVPSSLMQEVPPEQPCQKNPEIRSEIMKFVLSIREAVDNLQRVLDELKSITSSILLHQNKGTELEWMDME